MSKSSFHRDWIALHKTSVKERAQSEIEAFGCQKVNLSGLKFIPTNFRGTESLNKIYHHLRECVGSHTNNTFGAGCHKRHREVVVTTKHREILRSTGKNIHHLGKTPGSLLNRHNVRDFVGKFETGLRLHIRPGPSRNIVNHYRLVS